MAVATYGITTSKTDLNGLWRKVQGTLREAANFVFPEWDAFKAFRPTNVDWSVREITEPFDLAEGAGVASIVEGGWEARPSSPTVVDGTFSWIHLNKRFTVSKISRMIQQRNKAAMIADQMKYQGKKALEALGTWIADMFYGYSTAVRAKVTSSTFAGLVGTIVIKDAYGEVGLGSAVGLDGTVWATTLFRPDEYIALIRAGALVANSIGKVTAVDGGAGTITVSFAVAPAPLAEDQIVFANSLENTTLEGTDYNKGLTGFFEAARAVSLQGISSTVQPRWKPALVDTAAGNFTPTLLRRMRQAIANRGGGTMTDVRMSEGVNNSLFTQLQAGVVFQGMNNLEMDGEPKANGLKITTGRHVPPGTVWGYDRNNTVQKMVLLTDDPKAPTWDDGEKIPDRSAYVYPIDYPCQMVWTNRGNLAFAMNKTEA